MRTLDLRLAWLQYPAGYQKEKENKNEVEVEEGTPSKAKRKRKSQGNGELSILPFPNICFAIPLRNCVNCVTGVGQPMFNMLLDLYRTNYDMGLWDQIFPHLLCYLWIHNVSFTESPKSSPAKTPKKVKVEEYKLTREQKTLIKNDTANKKVWDEAMQSLSLGPVRIAAYLYTVNKFLICER